MKKTLIYFLFAIFVIVFNACDTTEPQECNPGDIVVFGDSNSFLHNWELKLNYPVCNYAFGGATVTDMLEEAMNNKYEEAGCIVIMVGTNDITMERRSALTIKLYYMELLDAIMSKVKHTNIVLCCIFPYHTAKMFADFNPVAEGLNVYIREIADSYGFGIVDVYNDLYGQDSLYSDIVHITDKAFSSIFIPAVQTAIDGE